MRARSLSFVEPHKSIYSFKHSGNAGDIIYSLPTIKALCKDRQGILYLRLNMPGTYNDKHPLGTVTLNKGMLSGIRPLLESQSYIKECKIFNGEHIDYDLDLIREYPFPSHSGHIARWYFLVFAINADLGKRWLKVQQDPAYADYIVIARSQRYHAPGIDYSFLNRYPKLIFLGVPAEYEAIKREISTIQYVPVSDFLQMAKIIAGAKFFIGNQSFPFSIAEALKVKRLLEVCHLCPNVIVEGIDGYDFCYQPQFEKLVAELVAAQPLPSQRRSTIF